MCHPTQSHHHCGRCFASTEWRECHVFVILLFDSDCASDFVIHWYPILFVFASFAAQAEGFSCDIMFKNYDKVPIHHCEHNYSRWLTLFRKLVASKIWRIRKYCSSGLKIWCQKKINRDPVPFCICSCRSHGDGLNQWEKTLQIQCLPSLAEIVLMTRRIIHRKWTLTSK